MTRDQRLPAPLALAVVLFLTPGGCLPRGEAPAGRQILADRTAVLAGIVPVQGDGVVRVLFFRPGKDADNVNLWVLAVDPNGGPSTEKMLFADIDTGIELGYRPTATGGGYPTDAQGRVYFSRLVPSNDPSQLYTVDVMRADSATGEVVDLGSQAPGVAVPPGPNGYPTVSNYAGSPLVFDANGGVTVADVASYGFGGSTAFYLTTDGTLVSLDTTGTARQLATGVATFMAVSAQTVLITRAVTDPSTIPPPPDPFPGPPPPPAQVTGALLDTVTLVETPLPDGFLYQHAYRPSPSGRWLIVNQMSQDPNQSYGSGAVLLDTMTGAIDPLESTFSNNATWRPGHDELWATSMDDPEQTGLPSTASLSIKKPGLAVQTVAGVYFTRFSDDGAFWFSRGAPIDAQDSSDLVGLADDPAGPRFPAVPAGSSLDTAWSLGDGRLLDDSFAGLDNFENDYVQLVDPRNGVTLPVGERGILSAVGTTRALGIYHMSYLRGDLTTTDFATGRSTVLAAEFAQAAIAEPQGPDPYPPGGRIVYQFVARFDSPWDGLWMATVP